MKIVLVGAVLAAGGCASSLTTQTTTPLVALPNGGQIGIQVVQQAGNKDPVKGPLAVWKTPDGGQKVFITLVPAPGSPGPVLRLDSSTPRYSSDGNRCWLLSNNEPVASFDYITGIAILGPSGQPEWAKSD